MLNLYYPVHFYRMFGYLGAANLEFDVPIVEEYVGRIQKEFFNQAELSFIDETNLNFREKGFENRSIFNNVGGIVTLVG